METNNAGTGFQRKVWITASIVVLIVVVLWLLKAIFNVLLLVLAGVLIALYFRGLAGLINRKLRLPQKGSLAIAVIGSLLLLIGFFWFAGSRIQQQVAQLSDALPSAVDNAKQQLNQSAIGQKILEKAQSADSSKKAAAVIQTFFSSTFGVLGDVYVVLFLGIFFTVSPKTYANGFLKLMPLQAKPRATDVVNNLDRSLTKWLKGKIFAMLIVFVLTAVGLVIIGMPMWLVLALIAGLLNFIPNFGPLIAMIPAVLVAFMQSSTTALVVAGLYILVQVLESNFITPQIQKKLINIPPALIIIAQLIMGTLTGGWGLLLATPLMLIVMVLVQELYLKPANERGQ